MADVSGPDENGGTSRNALAHLGNRHLCRMRCESVPSAGATELCLSRARHTAKGAGCTARGVYDVDGSSLGAFLRPAPHTSGCRLLGPLGWARPHAKIQDAPLLATKLLLRR